jgi:hypothetical protein
VSSATPAGIRSVAKAVRKRTALSAISLQLLFWLIANRLSQATSVFRKIFLKTDVACEGRTHPVRPFFGVVDGQHEILPGEAIVLGQKDGRRTEV